LEYGQFKNIPRRDSILKRWKRHYITFKNIIKRKLKKKIMLKMKIAPIRKILMTSKINSNSTKKS
jgi:hypothetical protein